MPHTTGVGHLHEEVGKEVEEGQEEGSWARQTSREGGWPLGHPSPRGQSCMRHCALRKRRADNLWTRGKPRSQSTAVTRKCNGDADDEGATVRSRGRISLPRGRHHESTGSCVCKPPASRGGRGRCRRPEAGRRRIQVRIGVRLELRLEPRHRRGRPDGCETTPPAYEGLAHVRRWQIWEHPSDARRPVRRRSYRQS